MALFCDSFEAVQRLHRRGTYVPRCFDAHALRASGRRWEIGEAFVIGKESRTQKYFADARGLLHAADMDWATQGAYSAGFYFCKGAGFGNGQECEAVAWVRPGKTLTVIPSGQFSGASLRVVPSGPFAALGATRIALARERHSTRAEAFAADIR